jgi:hypothetical protein
LPSSWTGISAVLEAGFGNSDRHTKEFADQSRRTILELRRLLIVL